MLLVLGVQKGALVVIEPPRKPRVARVFEIHDGIFIAVEESRVKELGGLVSHARILKLSIRVNRARDESAEVSS
jgi:hypothetical protein